LLWTGSWADNQRLPNPNPGRSGRKLFSHVLDRGAAVIVVPTWAAKWADVLNNISRSWSIHRCKSGIIIMVRHWRRFTWNFEKEAEAALGLPPGVHSYAPLPIGYPMGRFGPVRRVALADIVYEDRWGEPYRDL
jgi:hypothetical protein